MKFDCFNFIVLFHWTFLLIESKYRWIPGENESVHTVGRCPASRRPARSSGRSRGFAGRDWSAPTPSFYRGIVRVAARGSAGTPRPSWWPDLPPRPRWRRPESRHRDWCTAAAVGAAVDSLLPIHCAAHPSRNPARWGSNYWTDPKCHKNSKNSKRKFKKRN